MANRKDPTARDVERLRNDLGETQEEFARRFGVQQSTVHRWETEGPKSGMACAAIRRLMDDILGPRARRPREAPSAVA